MNAKQVIPVLNVSDMEQSFLWFEKLGWKKAWDWGTPPTFGAVCSGDCTVFLCKDAQGGRGKGRNATTGDGVGDQGVWLCVMVQDLDPIHRNCVEHGIEITFPPTDEPWGIRELHVRHPDGHVLRIGHELEHEHDHNHDHEHPHGDHDHHHH